MRHELVTRKSFFELNDFLAEGVGNPIDIIRKVRSVLETHCKKNYPAHFDSADTLGNICEKVRLAGNVHPLGSIYTTLDELNEYTRPFHHGHNPQASLEDIDGTELSGAVRRTLVCVGLIH
ncbi:MAG: hypothetical protein IPK79_13240 [Vampirovibrionales bacterium]|nr:hypothetical protein [Vampirovibrionales bacterium]